MFLATSTYERPSLSLYFPSTISSSLLMGTVLGYSGCLFTTGFLCLVDFVFGDDKQMVGFDDGRFHRKEFREFPRKALSGFALVQFKLSIWKASPWAVLKEAILALALPV